MKVALSFATALALGFIIWFTTNSALASYLVAVLTMAAAMAALFLSGNASKSIRSKVSVNRSKNAKVTGVSTRRTEGRIDSTVRLNRADEGDVTGVRED